MANRLRTGFGSIAAPARGVLVVFADDGLRLGSATQALLKPTGDLFARAAAADNFKGKNGTALDLVAPQGLKASRLIAIGVGKA
jgi:leucyl aminopeptidase